MNSQHKSTFKLAEKIVISRWSTDSWRFYAGSYYGALATMFDNLSNKQTDAYTEHGPLGGK